MTGFRRIDQETVGTYDFFSVVQQRWETPTGTSVDRLLVAHPGASVIIPVENGSALCLRQFRTSVGRELLEVPAGKLDTGDDDPLAAAQRELLEETGRTAAHWQHLSSFLPSPGFCDEVMHCYLATGLSKPGRREPDGPEEAVMTEEWISLDRVPELVASGELEDAKTILGLLLASARSAP